MPKIETQVDGLDYESRRKGLLCAAAVKLLASEAPDSYSVKELRKVARRLDNYYGFTAHEKKLAIQKYLKGVGDNATTAKELADEFGWQPHVIRLLIAAMEDDGTVETYTSRPENKRGRPGFRVRLLIKNP